MINKKQILTQSVAPLSEGFAEEIRQQGHNNTGALIDSIKIEVNGSEVVIYANDYAKYVDQGHTNPSMKQLPFVIEFVKTKMGKTGKEAVGIAVAIIKTWIKEGSMPTAASSRFSSTGERKKSIQNAFDKNIAITDKFMDSGMDLLMNQEFSKEKSETI